MRNCLVRIAGPHPPSRSMTFTSRKPWKSPAGMLLVPLGIGAVIHTLAPDTRFFGSFTGAMTWGNTKVTKRGAHR